MENMFKLVYLRNTSLVLTSDGKNNNTKKWIMTQFEASIMCRKIGSILKSRDLLENLSHYYFGLSHSKVLPGSEQYVILNELRRQVQLWNMRYRCSARPSGKLFDSMGYHRLAHMHIGTGRERLIRTWLI